MRRCAYVADPHVSNERTAWFHCFSGVSGDMTLGALLDAGADHAAVAQIVDLLGIEGWSLNAERVERQGLMSTRAIVGAPEDHRHHRPYRLIRERLLAAPLPPRVRERACAVFEVLAVAEAALHGTDVDSVEFHEVGSLDAIVDIVGVCAALEVLGVDRVVCSPISVGMGEIRAAHGVLPNPAPAVAAIAARHGLTLVGRDEPTELATPTGVALMAALADSSGPMPTGTVVATGLGAGGRNPEHRPNVVQVMLLDHNAPGVHGSVPSPESLVLLETNLDDVTGEVLAFVIDECMRLGALDAWVTPIVMKKGRPAHTLRVLCAADAAAALRNTVMAQTGTLGIRVSVVERWAASRDVVEVDIDGHRVRVKRSEHRLKAEFDDAASAARALGRPLAEVQSEAARRASEQ